MRIENDSIRWMLLLFLISLVLKLVLGIGLFTRLGTSVFSDDWDYIGFAKAMMQQGIWVPDASVLKNDLIGPGYPLLVAIVFFISGKSILWVVIVNCFLSSLLTPLAFWIGRRCGGNRVGWIASLLTIPFVPFYLYNHLVLKDILASVLLGSAVYFVSGDLRKNHGFVSLLLPAGLFTYLFHCDERYLIYVPLFLAFVFIISKANRRSFKNSILFLLFCISLSVPWFIRNWTVYHRPVFLTQRMEQIIRSVLMISRDDKAKFTTFSALDDYALTPGQIEEIKSGRADFGRHPLEIEWIKSGKVPHRFDFLERMASETRSFWFPWAFSPRYINTGFRFQYFSFRHNMVLFICYGLTFPFFLLGLYMIIKKRDIFLFFILAIIACHYFIHVVIFHVLERYRLPIDLFYLVIMALGIDLFLKRISTLELTDEVYQ